jgi:plastocyanin
MRGFPEARARGLSRRWIVTAIGGLAVAIALLLPTAGTALAAGGNVTIAGFAFAPATLKVHVGDTVTWTNNDSVGHTATSTGAFDTGTIASGSTATVTMTKAGTLTYHCAIHRSMTGTIVVAAAGASTPALPPTDASPDAVAGSSGYGWIILLAAIGAIAATLLEPVRRGARRGRRG